MSITNGEGADAWIDLVDEKSVEFGLTCLAFSGIMVVVVENADYKDKLFLSAYTVANVCLGGAY